MDVNRRKNWNCYNYGGFGHLAKHCRNRGVENGIRNGRRLEYRKRLKIKENGQSNLNGERDLVVLN